jgi:hypothetical protein
MLGDDAALVAVIDEMRDRIQMTDRREASRIGLLGCSARWSDWAARAAETDGLTIDANGVTLRSLIAAGPVKIAGNNALELGAGSPAKK